MSDPLISRASSFITDHCELVPITLSERAWCTVVQYTPPAAASLHQLARACSTHSTHTPLGVVRQTLNSGCTRGVVVLAEVLAAVGW